MKLAASAGHNEKVTGAHGFIVEHIENRKVLAGLEKYIKQLGWTFVNCTDDTSSTKDAIINGAIKKHNAHPDAESDVQMHFNASSGTHDRAIGVECIISTKARAKDRERAERITDKLAKELGLPRRKTIVTDYFGFPRQTVTGIIIEICFVNSKADTDAYKKAGPDTVGKWIAEAIANKEVTAPESIAPKVVPQVIKPAAGSVKLGEVKISQDVKAYAEPKFGTETGTVYKKGDVRHIYAIKNGWYQMFNGEWIPSNYGKNFEYEPVKKPEPTKVTPKLSEAKPVAEKTRLRRVIVDGERIGSFGDDSNLERNVLQALKKDFKKIEVEDV